MIQVETMESRRARELANAYIQLGVEYEEWEVDQQERVRNLRAIQASFEFYVVSNHLTCNFSFVARKWRTGCRCAKGRTAASSSSSSPAN